MRALMLAAVAATGVAAQAEAAIVTYTLPFPILHRTAISDASPRSLAWFPDTTDNLPFGVAIDTEVVTVTSTTLSCDFGYLDDLCTKPGYTMLSDLGSYATFWITTDETGAPADWAIWFDGGPSYWSWGHTSSGAYAYLEDYVCDWAGDHCYWVSAEYHGEPGTWTVEGLSDVSPVPLPAGAALLASAGGLLAILRRRSAPAR